MSRESEGGRYRLVHPAFGQPLLPAPLRFAHLGFLPDTGLFVVPAPLQFAEQPVFRNHFGNIQGGLSGPAIRPIALLKVHQVYQECRERGIPVLPRTLDRAVDALVADEVLRAALGTTPHGDYIDYYARTKRDEFYAWHATVSDWEINRYLTLF